MPIRKELRRYYGHHWRTVTRPAILLREGGRFRDGRYEGAAKCSKCSHIDCLPEGRSELDVAHLVIPPGDPGHDAHTNLAALCHPCHRAHDYEPWARLYRAWLKQRLEQRITRKDEGRPILAYLKAFADRGQAAQDAVDRVIEKIDTYLEQEGAAK